MEKVRLSIDEIRIMFNIYPDSDDYTELTVDKIYHPSLKKSPQQGLSKYPLLTTDLKYPPNKIFNIAREGYPSIIALFFNKTVFKNKMNEFISKKRGLFFGNQMPKDMRLSKLNKYLEDLQSQISDENITEMKKQSLRMDIEKQKVAIYEHLKIADIVRLKVRDSTLKHNIMIMLRFLFPTYYPAKFNISDSYNEYILRKSPNFNDFNLITYDFNNTSYLKINQNIYTITKVTWLNDVINHPLYRDFLDKFVNFSKFIAKQIILADRYVQEQWNDLHNRFLNGIYNFKKEEQTFKEIYDKMTSDINGNSDIRLDYKRENIDNLNSIVNQLRIFNELVDTFLLSNYDKMYSTIVNIQTLYNALTSSRNILVGISANFNASLNKCLEEFKEIYIFMKIKEQYLLTGNVEVQLNGEDPNIIEKIKNKFSSFAKLMNVSDKLKSLMLPIRTSTNAKLQQLIIEYAANKKPDELNPEIKNTSLEIELLNAKIKDLKKQNNSKEIIAKIVQKLNSMKMKLSELMSIRKKKIKIENRELTIIMKNAYNELIYLKNMNYFNNKTNFENLYVGTCEVDMYNTDPDAPNFEIYLAIDTVEGQLTTENIKNVACTSRSLYIGNEFQDYVENKSPYDIKFHRNFVKKTDLKNIFKKQNTNKTNKKLKRKIGGKTRRKSR